MEVSPSHKSCLFFSNRNHLQEAKKGPCRSTKPSFKSSWYFKHSMRYFPPMNAEMLVHSKMLATPIIKPSWMRGRIFWVPQQSVIFPCLSFPQRYQWSPEMLTFIQWVTKEESFVTIETFEAGNLPLHQCGGKIFASLNSYQVNTRSRTDFKALMYARRRQKFRGDFYKRKPVSLLQAADSTVSPACFSEWIISFPVTSCSEEVYHETSITNSHSEQQNSFDMCRHAFDFSLSS